jgi:hypothetical protein
MRLTLPDQRLAEAPGSLFLETGPLAGQYYEAHWVPCQNPVCPCMAISLVCIPTDRDGIPLAGSTEGMTLVFNLANNRIDKMPNVPQAPQVDLFVAAVSTETTSRHWQELGSFFLYDKYRQANNADLDQIQFKFSPHVFANENTLVPYGEVFPYSELLLFDYLSAKWRARECFCIKTGCDCETVTLEFSRAGEPRDATLPPPPAIRYDYGRNAYEVLNQSPPGDPPGIELFAAFQKLGIDLASVAKFRHYQMRYLFSRDKMRRLKASSSGDKYKPGRNDPCPCGSGMKFKKCCGALKASA